MGSKGVGPIASLSEAFTMLCQEAHPALMGGVRLITEGDERHLTGAEALQFRRSAPSVRRASGAARAAARELLGRARAHPPWNLCKQASGAPEWPAGFSGSLAHDPEMAVAVVIPSEHLRSVGVDIEPATPLPPELLHLIATKAEISQISGDLVKAKLLFCVKEAVYKATNVLDGIYLEHHDVAFSFSSQIATVKDRWDIKVHILSYPRLIALAIVT
jgi:4'-phosphopantetheinyl transferase EntD